MKLAEALAERADLQKTLAQLEERIVRNAKVQEGDVPAEDPQALLALHDDASVRLGDLVAAINRANLVARLPDGTTMTDALARRDSLRQRVAIHRRLSEAATVQHERYTRTELRFVAAIPVADVQARVDALSKALRELEAQIQATNWTLDFPEAPMA